MQVLHLGEVGSTSDHAKTLLAMGANAPFWVRADVQTAGRGRMDRLWISEPGNLYCTGVIPTARPIRERHRYSFAAALAVRDVLKAHGVYDVELKWPNDVLVDRRKVAGILLETEGDHVLVGIGINLAHHPGNTRWPATHAGEHGWTGSVDGVFDALTKTVSTRFGQDWDRIHRDWMVHACCIGEEFSVTTGERRIVGTHAGLGPDGELLLRTHTATIPVVSGELEYRV